MRAFETTVTGPMPEVEAFVRAGLQEQGFGVLTEIDGAAIVRAKIGVERTPLKILGACNPHFAQRALDIDPPVSLLLPCNVVLETAEDGTHVAIAHPRELMSDLSLEVLAGEAAEKLEAVIASRRESPAFSPTREPQP